MTFFGLIVLLWKWSKGLLDLESSFSLFHKYKDFPMLGWVTETVYGQCMNGSGMKWHKCYQNPWFLNEHSVLTITSGIGSVCLWWLATGCLSLQMKKMYIMWSTIAHNWCPLSARSGHHCMVNSPHLSSILTRFQVLLFILMYPIPFEYPLLIIYQYWQGWFSLFFKVWWVFLFGLLFKVLLIRNVIFNYYF